MKSGLDQSLVNAKNIDITPWSMYQQNAAHTGFVDVKLDPKTFVFSWKTKVGDDADSGLNYSLSGAVVAGSLVYVSRNNYAYSNTLQAFSTKDGHAIWEKSYGEVMINPPSVSNGKVYIQTVNNESTDTALYAYDAISGKIIFKSPTSAQWEHYLAPTIYKGNVYIDGGGYGGMYSVDQKTGQQNWFTGLGQYDMWTPAVNDAFAVAYTDGQLNVLDRITGKVGFNITDPHYQWSGYSTNFAPVLINSSEVAGIQSGYLTLFDLTNKNIKTYFGPGFIGQPACDEAFIYASQNDGLVAIDQATNKIKWKWFKDNENVQGQMIVTGNLIFLTTNVATYAIDKATHKEVWSYPVTGSLSLGMGYLFVVSHEGFLNAISVG